MNLKIVEIILVFIFGLAIGSFLNVLIYRLYYRKSLFGFSYCPNCNHRIPWYDNIPLISFIFLRGRCRYCHQRISWQYPIVELITAFLFLFAFLKVKSQIPVINYKFLILVLRDWLIIFAFIFIFVYDIKYLLAEHIVILPIGVIVFLLNLLLKVSLLKLLLAIGVSLAFFGVQYLLTKGKGIGLGDLSIGFLMGASLSWPNILAGLGLAYIIGAIVALFLVLIKKKKWKSKIALGPFLAIGTIISLFYGGEIINFYLSKIYGL